MRNLRIGLSTGCFHNQNILECLPLIRGSGFSTIEVCSAPPHLDYHDTGAVTRAAQDIVDLGMEAYSFHAPFAPQIDISTPDRARRESSVVEIMKAAKAAAILGVHYFVLHPGPENPAPGPPEEQVAHTQNVIESLNTVAAGCRDLGMICALENKLPHLLFGNTGAILWILDGMKAEVAACLDTGHAALSRDLHELTLKLGKRLHVVHAHDNLGNQDDHLAPGDGTIDWSHFLGDLVEIDFHGTIILEMAGTSDVRATLGNARRGRSFLRKLARTTLLPA
jgi:sugar phosphate isomerase/epimerase